SKRLNSDVTTVKDRLHKQWLLLSDAIRNRIVDDVAGTVPDTQTAYDFDFTEAIEKDLIKGI
ncbi:hypothetical protein AAVH_40894, partial [Aphelenchoides avenae]